MSGNELVITETDGEERSITLRGRSMPDTKEEPLVLGMTQRGRVNYPPWMPVADISIVGAVWTPTPMRGLWDDKYMDATNAPLLKKFKNLGTGGPDGILQANGRARNVVQVVEAFRILLRSGSTLMVEWGPYTMFGVLWQFEPSYFRVERAGWMCEFNWSGDTKNKPIIKPKPKLSPLGLLELLLKILEALRRAIQLLGAPAKFYKEKILAPFNQLMSAITDCINEFTKVIANAITPRKILGDLRAQFTKIKLAAGDLLRAMRQVVNFTDPLNPRDAALAEYGLIFMRKEVLASAAAMADRERELAKIDTPEIQDLVRTVQGETLRDVAKRVYGNPADWLIIATYNGLASAMVPENSLILVPSKAASKP